MVHTLEDVNLRAEYGISEREEDRIKAVLSLAPKNRIAALDVGAREGNVTRKLAQYYDHMTAVDLVKPEWSHPRVTTEQGDATHLRFANRSFDVVFCTEVLEHIRPEQLQQACSELRRVARHEVVIAVPYRQDVRHYARCVICEKRSPSWGHWNSFTQKRIAELFRPMRIYRVRYSGRGNSRTNWLADVLMKAGGDPWGHYEGNCCYCDAPLVAPLSRTLPQRVAGRLGHLARQAYVACTEPHPLWITALLSH